MCKFIKISVSAAQKAARFHIQSILKSRTLQASQKMALLQVLTIVVFANAVDVVLSCGGGSPPPPPPPPPPPCSWTTCKNVFKDDWAPPKAQGRCVEQLRSAHPDPTLHNGQGSCPAPQPCSNVEPEYRLLCKYECSYAWSARSSALMDSFMNTFRRINTKLSAGQVTKKSNARKIKNKAFS